MENEMDNEIISVAETRPVDLRTIKSQVLAIQEAMRDVMQQDVHFGTIPGTNKPTLLKPGAEKICMMFRLLPAYEVRERDLGEGHREYSVTCTLKSSRGDFMGQGLGSCSTMESKYRFRSAEPVATGRPVPREYWDARKAGDAARCAELIGAGNVTKKTDAGWFIFAKGQSKTENSNIADTYNTCLKMAKKRAHVDATITATAASDLFTQDVEELLENERAAAVAEEVQHTAATQSSRPVQQAEIVETVRVGDVPSVGDPVPGRYWSLKKTNWAEAQNLIGGQGRGVKKNDDGKWVIINKPKKSPEQTDFADAPPIDALSMDDDNIPW